MATAALTLFLAATHTCLAPAWLQVAAAVAVATMAAAAEVRLRLWHGGPGGFVGLLCSPCLPRAALLQHVPRTAPDDSCWAPLLQVVVAAAAAAARSCHTAPRTASSTPAAWCTRWRRKVGGVGAGGAGDGGGGRWCTSMLWCMRQQLCACNCWAGRCAYEGDARFCPCPRSRSACSGAHERRQRWQAQRQPRAAGAQRQRGRGRRQWRRASCRGRSSSWRAAAGGRADGVAAGAGWRVQLVVAAAAGWQVVVKKPVAVGEG